MQFAPVEIPGIVPPEPSWFERLLTKTFTWLADVFALVGQLLGAAGLHIGRSMAFPGARPVLAAESEAGQRGAVVMVGVVIMMVIAALLEAFPRQLVDGTGNRFLIGGIMLTF